MWVSSDRASGLSVSEVRVGASSCCPAIWTRSSTRVGVRLVYGARCGGPTIFTPAPPAKPAGSSFHLSASKMPPRTMGLSPRPRRQGPAGLLRAIVRQIRGPLQSRRTGVNAYGINPKRCELRCVEPHHACCRPSPDRFTPAVATRSPSCYPTDAPAADPSSPSEPVASDLGNVAMRRNGRRCGSLNL